MGRASSKKAQKRGLPGTRLYDRIMALEGTGRAHATPHFFQTLRGAQVIVGDAVSDYYFAGSDQEYWEVARDFPNLAPPFAATFVEFVAPAQITSAERGTTPWGPQRPAAWGALLVAHDWRTMGLNPDALDNLRDKLERNQEQVAPILAKALALGKGDIKAGTAHLAWGEQNALRTHAQMQALYRRLQDPAAHAAYVAKLRAEGQARWGVQAMIWIEMPPHPGPAAFFRRPHPYPLWNYSYHVHADGSLALISEESWAHQSCLDPALEERLRGHPQETWLEYGASISPLMHCVLLTISFLHCRNVTLREIDPLAAWRTQHHKKKDYTPLLTRYRVLDIAPMRRILRTEGREAEVGQRRALHICKGYFATYADEDGHRLFGKLSGRFWHEMHVRGSAEVGRVEKTYRAHPHDQVEQS